MTSHSRLNLIQIDTRERKNGFIEEYLADNDIPFFRSKMFVGDYKLHSSPYYVIDRKANMSEIYENITNHAKRFREELQRAKNMRIHLVVLIEDDTIKTLEDVKEWEHPHPEYHTRILSGYIVWKKLDALSRVYDCEFLFAPHEEYTETMLFLLKEAQDKWLRGIADCYGGARWNTKN